jgi:hypothetical protein
MLCSQVPRILLAVGATQRHIRTVVRLLTLALIVATIVATRSRSVSSWRRSSCIYLAGTISGFDAQAARRLLTTINLPLVEN